MLTHSSTKISKNICAVCSWDLCLKLHFTCSSTAVARAHTQLPHDNRHWTCKRLPPDSIRDSNSNRSRQFDSIFDSIGNFRFTGPYLTLSVTWQEGHSTRRKSPTVNPQRFFGKPLDDLAHTLANKTVVQLRPKSTTRSSFLLEYNRDFCRRYDPSPKNFSISHFCACFLSVWSYLWNNRPVTHKNQK